MANQADPGTTESAAPAGVPDVTAQQATVAGLPADGYVAPAVTPSQSGGFPPFHGRTVSWVAISVVIVGFLVGGLGLIAGPTWWAFWTGAGLAVLGMLIAIATNMFEDWY